MSQENTASVLARVFQQAKNGQYHPTEEEVTALNNLLTLEHQTAEIVLNSRQGAELTSDQRELLGTYLQLSKAAPQRRVILRDPNPLYASNSSRNHPGSYAGQDDMFEGRLKTRSEKH